MAYGWPCYSSRALAIIHAAFNDAYVSGGGTGRMYRFREKPMIAASPSLARVAAGRAAYIAANALYGRHRPFANYLMARYSQFLDSLQTGTAKPTAEEVREGQRLGEVIAAQVLAGRASDGSADADPREYVEPRLAGMHGADPVSGNLGPDGRPFTYAERWGGWCLSC